jgi:hypothetical protein
MKVALIDGDAIIYILAWQFKDQVPHGDGYDNMLMTVDQFITGIQSATECNHYLGALGHQEVPCFRYEIAKYKPYKATRRDKDEWVLLWEPVIRQRLADVWKFITYPKLEADDIISIAAEWYKTTGSNFVVCSPDKDLRQIAGRHFDYKKTEFHEISPLQAQYNFAYQMLVGDDSDNVAGLPGIGEKKATAALDEVDTTVEFYEQRVRNMYNKYFGNYYGNVIFEENKSVLGLVKTTHPQYVKSMAEGLVSMEQYKPYSTNNMNAITDDLEGLGWGTD